MEKREAVEILRTGRPGVESWNNLRAGVESIPDLSGVNLSRCDLTGVDLHALCLSEAFFGGSVLDRADLRGVDFRWADMPACRLSCANLTGANLSQANLRSACVANSDFTDSNLRGTNLVAVNLSSAVLHVADSGDARTSIRRAGELPLSDDVKHGLFEILQKMDLLDLPSAMRQQVANGVDDLIRELLKSPLNPEKVTELFALIGEIAPPLVAEVPQSVFVELGRHLEAHDQPGW